MEKNTVSVEFESALNIMKAYMIAKYWEKEPKYGHTWLKCPRKTLEDHIARHSVHLQESGYDEHTLAGMGLLCTMLLWRKWSKT